MRKLVVGLNLLILSMAPVGALAGPPLDAIKSRVGEVLAVLRDPALQGDAAKEAKTKRLRPIFDNTFDYVELSKATLSRNWEKFTPEQQQEFVKLYKAVLEKAYLNIILSYKDQEVIFGRERETGQNRFEVESKIVSASQDTPVQFRLFSKGNQWFLYDVVIENISIVANYRSQFSRLLQKESTEEMLANLRKQVG
jgi:phospholipid transport system substrate-binding protein